MLCKHFIDRKFANEWMLYCSCVKHTNHLLVSKIYSVQCVYCGNVGMGCMLRILHVGHNT